MYYICIEREIDRYVCVYIYIYIYRDILITLQYSIAC